MKRLTVALITTLAACSAAPAKGPSEPVEAAGPQTPAAVADPLRAAIDSDARPAEHKARDAYRHPYETLLFFGIQPTSTVVELWAGRGWYTAVLAPYLAASGKLYATTYASDGEIEPLRNITAGLKAWLDGSAYRESVTLIELNPPAKLDLGVDGQVDFVLTFRNVHNWVKGGYDRQVYEQAFRALKPGGILGVVEHRGPEGMTREDSSRTGYMDQGQVIADIEAVGFVFVEASEVNANPKDTKDHPEGVWTLPPTLRLGDVDRDKYLAIGESDRMTLKFRKP